MSKEIYISSTPHETRLAIVENDALAEIYYERENEYTLAGSIYNGKVTRVLPGMQSSFVDIGLERDAFLYITDFMEEAGDSAEFESNANSGDHQRAPRTEGGGGRGDQRGDARRDRGNRGDRGQEARGQEARGQEPRNQEPSDADLFTDAVSSLDPARPVSDSERGDRNGRSGGRNRRDRNFSSDGSQRRERGSEAPRAEGNRVEAPRVEAPIAGNVAVPDSHDEVGEGAPGADGSRRWRGRRGRRGNRGPGRDEAQQPVAAAPVEQRPSTTGPVYDAYPEALPVEQGFDQSVDLQASSSAVVDTPQAERSERSERGARNDRGRDRNRGDRGPQQPPRVPRGFAPKSDLYKVDSGNDELPQAPVYGVEPEETAPVVPIILPGESLSKYRPGGETAAAPVASVTAAPAPDFELPGGWDGGAVLPGETLRRREPGSNDRSGNDRSEPRREFGSGREGRDRGRSDRGRNDRGGNDRGGRGDRGPRNESGDARPERSEPAAIAGREQGYSEASHKESVYTEPVQGEAIHHETRYSDPVHGESIHGEASHSEPIATYLTEPEVVPASHLITPLDTTFVPPPPKPFETEPAGEAHGASEASVEPVIHADPASEPAAQVEREYEPTEGSASYRIDPVAPREFRQAAPSLEPFETAPFETAPSETAPFETATPEAGAQFEAGTQFETMTELETMTEPVLSAESEAPAAGPGHAAFDYPVSEFTAPPMESAAVEESALITSQPQAIEPTYDDAPRFSEPAVHEPGLSVDPVKHWEEAAPAEVDAPQFTSISNEGEMYSEPVEPVTHKLAYDLGAAPAAPIEHETAVVSQPAAHFAPGSGLLEEEEMDDEDEGEHAATLPALHASRDYESQEQETLEGAADLGTMLREMSIDQITRSEPAILGEEDDEDFLEEDQDYDSYAEEGDESELEEEEPTGSDDESEIESAAYSSAGDADPGVRHQEPAAAVSDVAREPRRDGRRDDRGRRDGRRGDRGRRPNGGERSASGQGEGSTDRGNDRGGSNERNGSNERSGAGERSGGNDRGRRDGRGGRQSMQSTNLPAISELLKPGQEILCQIAKEPIAKKGARITSHIALPGRFLVFMPTVNHTGVSRKIESDGERRRLKEILLSEKGEASGGFIVRTAAAGASEEELRSDLRFLLNLWADIKQRSESSKSPALIYHDLNLVERVLRDQVTDTFSAIWVDTETEYERVLRFLQRFQPSLIRRVKLYTKELPLFEQFGITEEINKALRSKVWLKSGGSIVINQTEALVAIDINTGKFVGKTARLEDTIVKTNLDAIPEIVRQIRLRDLGGIIIIDFIDMDERKNRNKVMAALEEELKSDRAPSKVLQFNDFGLVAITRKRVKQSLERTLSTTCGVCAGTGMTKSPVSVCNDIYIEMRKMHKHLDRGDVMLRVHPEVVKQLKSTTSKWLQEMEEMVGKTILVKSDPSLHPEQFDIH